MFDGTEGVQANYSGFRASFVKPVEVESSRKLWRNIELFIYRAISELIAMRRLADTFLQRTDGPKKVLFQVEFWAGGIKGSTPPGAPTVIAIRLIVLLGP